MNDKLAASSANLSDPFPGSRPGPLTALIALAVVGGGFIIHYWSTIKATLGF